MIEEYKGLISVIIPVYNAAGYLDWCFDSIIRQTYRRIEVLFVDDCSSDDSGKCIADFVVNEKASDLTVKCIRHEYNRGVAAARNTGLDNATGEYVYYLDADDYLEDNALEILYSEAEKTGADIIGCEWFLSFNKNERHMVQPKAHNGEELFAKMTAGVARWNLWLFMVRRSLYEDNRLRFIEKMNMGEDMMVMMKMSLYAEKVSILNIPLYHYIQTKSDSLTKKWSKSFHYQISANVYEVERHVRDNFGNRYDKEIAFLKLNIKLPLLISADNDNYNKWNMWFPESNCYIMKNKDIALRTRMIQWLADKHQYWLLKLYYHVVIKFIYGVLYK